MITYRTFPHGSMDSTTSGRERTPPAPRGEPGGGRCLTPGLCSQTRFHLIHRIPFRPHLGSGITQFRMDWFSHPSQAALEHMSAQACSLLRLPIPGGSPHSADDSPGISSAPISHDQSRGVGACRGVQGKLHVIHIPSMHLSAISAWSAFPAALHLPPISSISPGFKLSTLRRNTCPPTLSQGWPLAILWLLLKAQTLVWLAVLFWDPAFMPPPSDTHAHGSRLGLLQASHALDQLGMPPAPRTV